MDEKLVSKVLDNCASQQEAQMVAEFLAKDEGQALLSDIIDRNLRNLENGTENLMENIPVEEIYSRIINRIRRRRISYFSVCAVAAVVPILIFFGTVSYVNRMFDGNLFKKVEISKVTVPNGDKMQMVLNDGSTVYLNSGSKLSYPNRFSMKVREVSLVGEGYFKIEKNPRRPFIIHVPGGTVKVRGTSFDLCAYPQDNYVTLALDEGKVAMKVGDETYDVLPGQVLYLNQTDHSVHITTGGSSQKSKWMNGIISFKSATLEDIANNLGRIFDIEFAVSPDVDTTILYTFTSSRANLDQLLEELSYIAPITISRKNDIIFIDAK